VVVAKELPTAPDGGWGRDPGVPGAAVVATPAAEAAGAAPAAAHPAADESEEEGNWFATTRPSTLVAWGVIAIVGGLLLGAIGQVDPTDTLVIVAFLLVPLGLLLPPLALLCWVVQKATGRR